MDLVIHQMGQLHEIDIADRHLLMEGLPCPSVIQHRLPCDGQLSALQPALDLFFGRSIEDRGGNSDPEGRGGPPRARPPPPPPVRPLPPPFLRGAGRWGPPRPSFFFFGAPPGGAGGGPRDPS